MRRLFAHPYWRALYGRCRRTLRPGPGMVGFAVENCLRIRALEGPIAAVDFRLELAGRPARVSDEDTQAPHGLVAAEELLQQFPISAQIDVVKRADRPARRLR